MTSLPRHIRVFPLLVVLAAGVHAGCVTHSGELLLQSLEQDRALGRKVALQMVQETGIVPNSKTTEYLTAIGVRLCQRIPDRRFDYSFQILDQQEPNAFAAPGGFVFVSRGLLTVTNSEAELAGIVAHEITHVRRRHTAKQMAKRRLPNLLSLPGKVVGKVIDRDLGRLLNVPIGVLGGSVLASFSRQDEMEADQFGQELAARAGYDPRALGTALAGLEREVALRTNVTRRPTFFDTHPTTPRRLSGIAAYAQSISWSPKPGIAADESGFLHRLDGLIVGENPAKGIFRDQAFLHPEFDLFLRFPDNWTTVKTPRAAVAVAPERDGIMMLGVHGPGGDPVKVGTAFAEELTREFGVTPSQAEQVQVGEWPGYLVTVTDESASEAMNIHFLWVALGETIYQLIATAPERLRPTLRESALSLRPLTSDERASIKVTRLRIVAARAGEDLEALSIRTANVWDLRTTALMNAVPLDRRFEEDSPVKVAVRERYLADTTD